MAGSWDGSYQDIVLPFLSTVISYLLAIITETRMAFEGAGQSAGLEIWRIEVGNITLSHSFKLKSIVTFRILKLSPMPRINMESSMWEIPSLC